MSIVKVNFEKVVKYVGLKLLVPCSIISFKLKSKIVMMIRMAIDSISDVN